MTLNIEFAKNRIASATQAGVVSTVAQAFSGAKTFLEGLVGKTDGTASSSGNIGEIITITAQPSELGLTTNSQTFTTLTLPKGNFDVVLGFTVYVNNESTSANLGTTYFIEITDGNNSIITLPSIGGNPYANFYQRVYCPATTQSASQVYGRFNTAFPLTVSSDNTVIKVRGRRSDTNIYIAFEGDGGVNQPVIFYAKRIS